MWPRRTVAPSISTFAWGSKWSARSRSSGSVATQQHRIGQRCGLLDFFVVQRSARGVFPRLFEVTLTSFGKRGFQTTECEVVPRGEDAGFRPHLVCGGQRKTVRGGFCTSGALAPTHKKADALSRIRRFTDSQSLEDDLGCELHVEGFAGSDTRGAIEVTDGVAHETVPTDRPAAGGQVDPVEQVKH